MLLCGAYNFDSVPSPLITGLPEVLIVPAAAGLGTPSMRAVITVLSDELDRQEPGSQVVVDRFVDTLLIYSLRFWVRSDQGQQTSWLRALHDPGIGRALTAIHAHPEGTWTVKMLAQQACMSRSSFAHRFAALVGQPPLSYLTWWRMTCAAELLRETDSSVESIAARVGYTNAFAFATAFKHQMGAAPGRYRLHHHVAHPRQ